MTKTRIIELDAEDFVVRAPTLKQLRENTDKLIISAEEPELFQVTYTEAPEGDFAKQINGYLDLFKQARGKYREALKTQLHGGVSGARGIK
jgi:hypothetical protein